MAFLSMNKMMKVLEALDDVLDDVGRAWDDVGDDDNRGEGLDGLVCLEKLLGVQEGQPLYFRWLPELLFCFCS